MIAPALGGLLVTVSWRWIFLVNLPVGLAARALTGVALGVVLCFICVALLTSAVGVTWYGPGKTEPLIEVHLSNGTTQCGEIVSLSAGADPQDVARPGHRGPYPGRRDGRGGLVHRTARVSRLASRPNLRDLEIGYALLIRNYLPPL